MFAVSISIVAAALQYMKEKANSRLTSSDVRTVLLVMQCVALWTDSFNYDIARQSISIVDRRGPLAAASAQRLSEGRCYRYSGSFVRTFGFCDVDLNICDKSNYL